MKCRGVVGSVVALGLVASTASAYAGDETARSPPWAIRFEPGTVLMPYHLHDYGLVGLPPALYFGTTLERAIVGPVRANVSGGVSLLLGWLIGGTVRYAAIDRQDAVLSVGVGPLFAPDAAFGSAAFAQLDATVQLKIASSFGVVIGGSAAVALNSAGAPKTGGDTGEAYLVRGDVIGSARVGVGFAF